MDEWILLQHGVILYILIFMLLLGGAVGLPVPEDVPLLLAGILLQADKVDLQPIFIVAYCGVLGGDLIIYFVGHRFGMALFKSRWFKSRVPASRIRTARLRLEKRSILMIFIARHLFYLRTATFLTCGAVRMNPRKFILADGAAALVSLPIMMGLGYVAAEHYDTLLEMIEHAKALSLFIGIAVLITYLLYRKRKKTVEENGSGLKADAEI